MIRSSHYTSPFEQPVQKIVIASRGTEMFPIKDEYIYLRAKEFFDTNPKEQEVHICVLSRGIDMLIDRNHPEINSGTTI